MSRPFGSAVGGAGTNTCTELYSNQLLPHLVGAGSVVILSDINYYVQVLDLTPKMSNCIVYR